MFAEEASAEAVLNARDMAESDIVNLEKLFEQLNR
jgi:hypothetical protein